MNLLADYSELLNIIKKAATEAVDAGNPVAICFGKVTSSSPLQIEYILCIVLMHTCTSPGI